jgi:hypothetical protein
VATSDRHLKIIREKLNEEEKISEKEEAADSNRQKILLFLTKFI